MSKLLNVRAQELANGVPETELRKKEYLDQLRKQFRDGEYIPWARAMMNDYIYKKHGMMHQFWVNDFRATYTKALETRFDEHVPKASLNSLIASYLEQRWEEKVAPKKLDRLAADLKEHDDAYKKKLADIDKNDDLSTEEKEGKKKKKTQRRNLKRRRTR